MESCSCSCCPKMRAFATVVIFLFVSATISSVNSAKLISRNNTENGNEVKLKSNGTSFSRKQGLVGFSGYPVINPHSNVYFSTPSIYHNGMRAVPRGVFQFDTTTTGVGQVGVKEETKKSKRGSGSGKVPKVEEDDDENKEEETKKKKRKVSSKKKHKKRENEEDELVESKTVPDFSISTATGTKRGCPACIAGICDPTLDPSTNISGIPVIQIIIAAIVGAFWAGIFIFFLVNFIEHDKHGGGYGGGYAPAPPQYGAPVVSYGAAPVSSYGTPSSDYGTPSSSYSRIAKRQGRSSPGFSFDEVSTWVWNAIDKVAKYYDDDDN